MVDVLSLNHVCMFYKIARSFDQTIFFESSILYVAFTIILTVKHKNIYGSDHRVDIINCWLYFLTLWLTQRHMAQFGVIALLGLSLMYRQLAFRTNALSLSLTLYSHYDNPWVNKNGLLSLSLSLSHTSYLV